MSLRITKQVQISADDFPFLAEEYSSLFIPTLRSGRLRKIVTQINIRQAYFSPPSTEIMPSLFCGETSKDACRFEACAVELESHILMKQRFHIHVEAFFLSITYRTKIKMVSSLFRGGFLEEVRQSSSLFEFKSFFVEERRF